MVPPGSRVGKNGSKSALNAGISGVADAGDPAVFYADVGFDHAQLRVKDQGVRQDQIERLGILGEGGLPHPITDDFAAAKLDFVSIPSALRNQVALDLDEQVGVGEADL